MLENYLVINKSILPKIFEKILKVKQLMEDNDLTNISEAVKEVGISRSTFYKYKDFVFQPSSSAIEKKAVISFILSHEKGVLSDVLILVSSCGCNVITINQNIPIHSKAVVTMSMDVSEMNLSLENFLRRLDELKGVSRVNLVSVE